MTQKTLYQASLLDPKGYAQKAMEANASGQILNAVINGGTIEYILTEAPTETIGYQQSREQAYPPIGEQLDMLYWDRVNGTNIWAETLTHVKEKYPKA